MLPLCFVLMPFGRKADAQGRATEFDRVYKDVIDPAVRAAGLEPIRADEEQVGGTIHKPMFERLMLCDYAVADVTGANPNVYYELGVRHALRPFSTVIIFAQGTTLPFDLAPMRGLPYETDPAGNPASPQPNAAALAGRLKDAREHGRDDSPLFQMIEDMPRHRADPRSADSFRETVIAAQRFKDQLSDAREQGVEAVQKIAETLSEVGLSHVESTVIVDLFMALRAVDAHAEMVALAPQMAPALQRTRIVREQLGFALNRLGRRAEAEAVLNKVIAEYGPSAETNGLLGRVYKDYWADAVRAGRLREARAYLKRSIDAYAAGYETDWRNTYPGVNAVTLMEIQDPADPHLAELLPVVRYAALRVARVQNGYFDHATLLELAVLANDRNKADDHLDHALTTITEARQPQTTARTLRLLAKTRRERGAEADWIDALAGELEQAHARIVARRLG